MMMMMAMMMVIESDLGVTSPMLVTLSSSLYDKHIFDILSQSLKKHYQESHKKFHLGQSLNFPALRFRTPKSITVMLILLFW